MLSHSSRLSLNEGETVNSHKYKACFDALETYMEQLYEDEMEVKLRGAKMILQLAEFAGHMEVLIHDESLMSLLSRVLNDEYKKNYDFSLTLIRIFWCFSNFAIFHLELATYRIGNITLKIVEFELKRHQLRIEEEKVARKNQSVQDTMQDINTTFERDEKRRKRQLKKQNQLFLLLNLAEDIHTERKMVKRKITHFLVDMLDRTNPDLMILVFDFLKKLSIFEENKETMEELQIIDKIMRYLRCNHDKTVQSCMKLLFNLSFDPLLRDALVRNSIIPKLVELLKKPPFRALSLRILYHLSMDDRWKSMFTYTDAIPIVMQLVINFPQNVVAKELAGVVVNLSHNNRNVEMMCQNGGLEALVHRAYRTRDPLIMKVLHNISLWTYKLQEDVASDRLYKYKGLWAPYINAMFEMCTTSDNADFTIEVLGTLSNMTPSDISSKTSWNKLIVEFAILPYLNKLLVPGFSQDDILLEVILFVGAISLEPQCASVFASSCILNVFYGLLQEKQHDNELTLQLLYTFYRLLRHNETFDELVYNIGIVPDLLLLADSTNTELRRMCDTIMDLILDRDVMQGTIGQFTHLIKQRRFELHNVEYINMLNDEELNNRILYRD